MIFVSKIIFELNDRQVGQVSVLYERIWDEFGSNYRYKFDLIRNLIFELLHFALKMEPEGPKKGKAPTASERITTLFLELLERQFPIDEKHTEIHFRSPSKFTHQMNVHINHLNRVVKKTTGKTTSQIITERLLQEAKILLKHRNWGISEIAYRLGFKESTHFNNFFKKHTQQSPSAFRKV